MCGIAGLWRLTGRDLEDGARIDRMSRLLVHRGPDDHGYLLANTANGSVRTGRDHNSDIRPDLLLASRRLSILDLSASGRQPLTNEAGDVFVVFNGAIHNYLELRSELVSRGHVFRSQTDTEVIVHAYEEWGEDCAKRFNGMWAYTLWDSRRGVLVCSRDRFAIKPLFFAWHRNTFYFASEVKAILAVWEGIPAANPAFVKQFLRGSLRLEGRQTAFAGIEQVPAGHNLVISRDGVRESRYWSYSDRSEAYDNCHPEQTFRALLADAVRLRLRSDVPVALLLSGGLDSSALAVQRGVAGEVEAFTAVFPGFEGDEQRYARRVAAHAGIRLNVVEYDPAGFLDDLSSATWHMDSPPTGGQLLARLHLLAGAADYARVVLEGQGGDEILGGYPLRHFGPYIKSEIGRLRPWNLHQGVPRILAARASLKFQLRAGLRRHPSHFRLEDGRSLLSREFLHQTVASEMERAPPEQQLRDPLTNALVRDHSREMLPYLLHFGDAISMAHSVEARLPFLDHRLVEFTLGLPFDAKIRGGENKSVLRRALAAEIPSEILGRRDKVGFHTPLEDWIRLHFTARIRPLLTSSRIRERGVFDPEALESVLTGFESRGKHVGAVFRCLSLERWFEIYIDGKGFARGSD